MDTTSTSTSTAQTTRDITDEILAGMLRENTGRHILDSGGAYGRHWERNQTRDIENEDSARLEIKKWVAHDGKDYSKIMVYVRLFHFLRDRVTFAPEIDAAFSEFASQENESDNSWGETIKHFIRHQGYSTDGDDGGSFYTYNYDNMLDQDFVAYCFTDDEDNACVFIQSHNGCDARGGFSAPRAFYQREYAALYDFDRATITCGNEHWWDYDGRNWTNDERQNLEDFEIYNADELEGDEGDEVISPVVLAEMQREYAALNGSARLPGLEDVTARMLVPAVDGMTSAILIDEDGTAHCPLCSAPLSAYAPGF